MRIAYGPPPGPIPDGKYNRVILDDTRAERPPAFRPAWGALLDALKANPDAHVEIPSWGIFRPLPTIRAAAAALLAGFGATVDVLDGVPPPINATEALEVLSDIETAMIAGAPAPRRPPRMNLAAALHTADLLYASAAIGAPMPNVSDVIADWIGELTKQTGVSA